MSNVVPTFLESGFLFEGKPPHHIDEFPSVPSYVGYFALFAETDEGKPYSLAVDIPDIETARELAEARKLRQESDIDTYGYTDDVHIYFPNGETERFYQGRLIDDL